MRSIARTTTSAAVAFVLAASLISLSSGRADATTGWSQGTGGPTARFGHSMTFDPGNGVTVMFGGCTALTTVNTTVTLEDGTQRSVQNSWCKPANERNDTWIRNGATGQWSQVIANGATGSPKARYFASMTYDHASDSVILFGGLHQTSSEPSAPYGARSCFKDQYYGSDDQIAPVQSVVETGTSTNHYYYCFYDTWSLKKVGSAWQWSRFYPATKPSVRFDAMMAFDGNGRPTLIGGCNQLGLIGTHEQPNNPSTWDCTRYAHESAEHQINCTLAVVLPSLCGTTTSYNIDTWRLTWSGDPNNGGTPDWTRVGCTTPTEPGRPPCAPLPMRGASVSFDPGSRKIWFSGGYYYEPVQYYGSFHAETWLYDGATNVWTRYETTGVHDQWCPSLNARQAWSSATHAGIGGAWQVLHHGGFGRFFGQTPSCGPGVTDTRWPSGRPQDIRSWSDTWRWNNAACTDGSSSWDTVCWHFVGEASPPAREAAGLTYDHINGQAVLFGGRCASCSANGVIRGDTWVYAAPAPSASPNPCPGC